MNCTGQQPASGPIADLAPESISASGHIKVKSTLQIDDESLPNIYVCGDVADTHDANPNSRIAARQAEIAADNIVLAARGKKPKYNYTTQWGDGVIKLTLGLVSTPPVRLQTKCRMLTERDRTAPSPTSGTASQSSFFPARRLISLSCATGHGQPCQRSRLTTQGFTRAEIARAAQMDEFY